MARTPYEQGGIVGGPNMQALLASMSGGTAAGAPSPVNAPGMQADTPAAPAPNYQTLGQFSNRLQGVDRAKFDRPYDQLTEKYKVAMLNSHFDPSKGIQQEGYLDALNGLGIADYSGSADGLQVAPGSSRNGARYGEGGGDDVIYDYNKGVDNPNAMWGNWTSQAGQAKQRAFNESRQGGGQPMSAPMMNLQSDPTANIQQALAQYSQKSPNLMALMQQLGIK